MSKLKISIPYKSFNGIIKISNASEPTSEDILECNVHAKAFSFGNKKIEIDMMDGCSNATLTKGNNKYQVEIYCAENSALTIEDNYATENQNSIFYNGLLESTITIDLGQKAKGTRDIYSAGNIAMKGNISCIKEINLIGNDKEIYVNGKMFIKTVTLSELTYFSNFYAFYTFDKVVNLLSNFDWEKNAKLKISSSDDPQTHISAFNMRFYHKYKTLVDTKINETKGTEANDVIFNIESFLMFNYLQIYGVYKNVDDNGLSYIMSTISPHEITRYLSPGDIKIPGTLDVIGDSFMPLVTTNTDD